MPVRSAPTTESLEMTAEKSNTWVWPMLTQPASWAVRNTLATKPAATRMRKGPVTLKNVPMLKREPP